VTGKRYRLSDEELELVLVGLIVVVDEADDAGFSDDALELAQRLVQSRRGRPGGSWSDEARELWRRARALRGMKVST